MCSFGKASVSNSKIGYNPHADEFSTPIQKLERCFTERQMALATRPDVTKSLIVAAAKVLDFKQDINTLTDRWVKKDTKKFLRTLPLLVK